MKNTSTKYVVNALTYRNGIARELKGVATICGGKITLGIIVSDKSDDVSDIVTVKYTPNKRIIQKLKVVYKNVFDVTFHKAFAKFRYTTLEEVIDSLSLESSIRFLLKEDIIEKYKANCLLLNMRVG